METIEIRENVAQREKKVAIALVVLPLVCLALFCLHGGRLSFYTIFLGVIWVAAIVGVIAKKLKPEDVLKRDGGPTIVIDNEGLLDKRLGVGKILWSDIKRVYRFNLNTAPYICIETLRDNFYLGRRSGVMSSLLQLNRISGMQPLSISVAYLDTDPGKLFEIIARKHQANVR
jgi:hypothetical protein